jgi:hypothetical protein
VFGKRVYLQRDFHPIPVEHVNAATLLSIDSGVGLLFFVAGLLTQEPAAFIAGGAVVLLCKFWFIDRMVWLFEDMKAHGPEYAPWLR